jgi:hypothetical protein
LKQRDKFDFSSGMRGTVSALFDWIIGRHCSGSNASMKVAYARAVLALSVLFGGCAVHAQTETPAPKKPHDYLPVEDVPKRAPPAMTAEDRAKLMKELSAARDRQTPHAKPHESIKPAKPK